MCRKKLEALKDDPELAAVFEDIKNCGAAAMERYWNDTDLMTKISQKMGALGVGTQPSKAAKHIPVWFAISGPVAVIFSSACPL